ncbi:MAG: cytochrome c3 family protein [Ignavibacteria bacterium]|nr:cytochrome c3 family protein [Ignavibacteria bacterium]
MTNFKHLYLSASFFLIILFFQINLIADNKGKFSTSSNDDCLACHSDNTLTMERNGKQRSLFVDEKILAASPHKKLECVSCHAGFNPEEMPHKENIQPIDCMTCHKDAKIRHLFHPQMFYAKPLAEGKDVSCRLCHGTHDAKPFKNIGRTNSIAVCAKCHTVQNGDFYYSAHGYGNGANEKPGCITCHKEQITTGSYGTDKVRLKSAQQNLCLSCHNNITAVTSRFAFNKKFISNADSSTHSRLIKGGNGEAASCVDCHGSHKIKNKEDQASNVYAGNIPNTCGGCHKDIKADYSASIHYDAFTKKVKDAPVCSSCHNEHETAEVKTEKICAGCHQPVEISPDYALSNNKTKVSKNNYHGIEVKDNKVTVSNCASCHGPHKIINSKDAGSAVNKKNLQATCGKCHPGAETDFVSGTIHKVADKPVKPVEKKEEPSTSTGGSTFLLVAFIVVGIGLIIGFLYIRRKKKSDTSRNDK